MENVEVLHVSEYNRRSQSCDLDSGSPQAAEDGWGLRIGGRDWWQAVTVSACSLKNSNEIQIKIKNYIWNEN